MPDDPPTDDPGPPPERLVALGRLREAGLALGRRLPADAERLRDEWRGWQAALAALDGVERRHGAPRAADLRQRQRLATQLLALCREAEATRVLLAPRRAPVAAVAAPAAARLRAPAAAAAATAQRARRVFLSYNHADREAACEVAAALATLAGCEVTVDSAAMRPGESIRGFIADAVARTEATVCVVSAASLQSAWVCSETVLALAQRTLAAAGSAPRPGRPESAGTRGDGRDPRDPRDPGRAAGGHAPRDFVACTLDARYLDPGFRLEATRAIDQRLAVLQALSDEHAALRIGTEDLDDERARLHALRHHLGDVLALLRGSLALDIAGAARAAGLARLAAHLRGGAAGVR